MIATMVRFGGAAVLVCMLASVAAAETSQEKADRLFGEGRAALTANDSKLACEKFEEAIKIDVSATGTMLNLGLCYENLGKYASSLYWFRKAQAAASENKLTDYENAAKEHTSTISSRVSTLTITVQGSPEAEVRVDGRKVEPTEYGRYEVNAGEHEVVGTAPGKARETVSVTVAQAENKPVSLALRNEYVVDRGKNRRLVAYIGAGVGTAALVGLGIWGIAANDEYHQMGTTKDRQDELNDQAATYGTGTFIVGTALIAGAALLYFTAPGKESVIEGSAFAPIVTQDQLGLAAVGRF